MRTDRSTELLPPWEWITDEEHAKGAIEELNREMAPVHVLRGVPVRAIAIALGEDDCLFELRDGTGRVAVVHFSWSEESSPDWPCTAMYESLEAWRADGMDDDHGTWLWVHEWLCGAKIGNRTPRTAANRNLNTHDDSVEVVGNPRSGFRLFESIDNCLRSLGTYATRQTAVEAADARHSDRNLNWTSIQDEWK